MSTSLKKFVQLREALVAEKAGLEVQVAGLQDRLAEINAALGDDSAAAPATAAKRGPGRPPGRKKKAAAKKKGARKKAAKKKAGRPAKKRSRSAVPLKETMVKVIGKGALSRQEIAAGVEAAGYSSANILNSVSATLYQNKSFTKVGKKWKLA